jgi:8-oxo-dGTP diphosphatase
MAAGRRSRRSPAALVLEGHLPEPAIAAAVIVRDGSVLLVRRRVAEDSLSWQFPAGKVEPGESAREAAVREAREEAGVMSASGQVLGDRMHPVTGRRVIYVACDLISGTARVANEDEIAEVAWCDLGEVPDYVPLGFFVPVQEYLDAMLEC